ncbi:MAG TPA: RNA polymerase sigma factor [Bacilli bacterium]|jgi:RNA polymerase sigma-70 factor (ECF subfamily)|nr:RNA polymerase sigma factor [Bacilli bacterium]
MKSRTETALVKLQQGDQDGLTDLYEVTSRAVFAFTLSVIADYQLAEDIMQETYIRVYQSIDSYRKGTNGLSWILTIAKNIALTMLERRQREERIDFDAQHERAGATVEVPNFENPTIDLAKKILPEDEQQILFLYAIGEYKHREIADLLGLPLGTVTWKYQIAIKKMREHLKKGGQNDE